MHTYDGLHIYIYIYMLLIYSAETEKKDGLAQREGGKRLFFFFGARKISPTRFAVQNFFLSLLNGIGYTVFGNNNIGVWSKSTDKTDTGI